MNRLKILIAILVVLMPVCGWSYTETFYVCHGGDGSLPETATCSTAWDESDFNDPSNWGVTDSDDGKIGPGDIVYRMSEGGNFTKLKMQGSGLSGYPITVAEYSGNSIASVIEGDNPCPAWYADSGVVWSWNGEHPLGHNYACNNSGTAIVANNDTVTTDVVYGETDSVGLAITGVSQYLQWTQTNNQYLSSAADQTMCVRYKFSSGGLTADTMIFSGRGAGANDIIDIQQRSNTDNGGNERVYGILSINGVGGDSAYGTFPADNTWVTVGYSWKDTSSGTGDHSCNPGDQTPWANAWEEDVDELTDTPNPMTSIILGNYSGVNGPAGSEYVYVDRAAIVNGYEFDCSTLTGW